MPNNPSLHLVIGIVWMLSSSSVKLKSNDSPLSLFSSNESSSFQTASYRLPLLLIGCHRFVSNFVVASKLNEHRCRSTGLLNASSAYVLVNLNAARSNSCSELPAKRSISMSKIFEARPVAQTYPIASVDRTMHCCHSDR